MSFKEAEKAMLIDLSSFENKDHNDEIIDICTLFKLVEQDLLGMPVKEEVLTILKKEVLLSADSKEQP